MTATTTIIRPDVSPAKVSRPVSIALRGPSTTANAHAATKYDIQEHSRPPLPQPFDNIPKLLAHLVTWLCWLCYFQYRFVDTASSNQHHGVKDWFNWMLFVSELVLLLPDLHTAIELTMSLLPGSGRPSRPLLRLVGDAAPMVHVLITCCGEDIRVIMDTAAAAAAQEYPLSRLKVFLLDDAKDAGLRSAVDAFNSDKAVRLRFQRIIYHARDKVPSRPHYYKAGNLHEGLKITAEDPEGSEYFAALDADMIPERDWLARTVPHLIRDGELAMAGPPQIAYNVPVTDPLSQDSNVFAKVTEPVHDKFNAYQCSGSGYVMRRSALDDIGGWPLVNVGDDIVCSYLLTGAGWKCAFIEDQLQFGEAPGSLHSYVSQRVRWSNGSLLVAKRFKFFLPLGESRRQPIARAFAVLHALKPYMAPLTLATFVVVPAIFLSIALSTDAAASMDRNNIRGVFALLWSASQVSRHLIYGPLGTRNMINMMRNRYWTLPYTAYCAIRSIFVDASHLSFKVTGVYKSPANERSATHRQPLPWRMLSPLMLFHQGLLLVPTIGFVAWICHAYDTRRLDGGEHYLYTGLTLRLVDMVFAASVPVQYMLFPPTVPEREALLTADKDGLRYAKSKRWVKRDGGVVTRILVDLLVILYLDWM